MSRRTPPRGTPAPAVLAGGVRRFDDESDPFAPKASARDRGVDSAGNAALAEEVARLRAQLARATEARDTLSAALSIATAGNEAWAAERDSLRAEVERLTAERDARASEPTGYYIQNLGGCGNEALWWRADRCGYTANLDEAGVYSEADAKAQERERDQDVAWPCAVIDALSHRAAFVHVLRAREASR